MANHPNIVMRFSEADKNDLKALAISLNRSQTDTMRVLVREARHILPELKARATSHPLAKVGRRKRTSISKKIN